MADNLGVDLMITSNEDGTGDWIIGNNGDFLTTQDYEQKNYDSDTLPFEGYVCISETIYRLLQSDKGSWIFDSTVHGYQFGANLSSFLSNSVSPENLFLLEEQIEIEILKDSRIKSVQKVSTEFQAPNVVIVRIKLITINADSTSELVFPYSF